LSLETHWQPVAIDGVRLSAGCGRPAVGSVLAGSALAQQKKVVHGIGAVNHLGLFFSLFDEKQRRTAESIAAPSEARQAGTRTGRPATLGSNSHEGLCPALLFKGIVIRIGDEFF